MEAFYQESGRAGRDQLPSTSLLYYGIDDRKRMEFILSNAKGKKLESSSSDGGSSRKSLVDFKQMIEYCEGSGCRREKILKAFGEQASTSLCAKTCDACKHPNLVARHLEELTAFNAQQKHRLPPIFMRSSLDVVDAEHSEFWDRRDEGLCGSDEEISDSDEDVEVSKTLASSKLMQKSHLSEKMDILQRAEESYYRSNGFEKKTSRPDKNAVSDSLRASCKQKLLDALRQTEQRLGRLSTEIEFEWAAAFLEEEGYKKYGRSGKSFYISQLASTVRWLSSCCSVTHLMSRLGNGNTTSSSRHIETEADGRRPSDSSLLSKPAAEAVEQARVTSLAKQQQPPPATPPSISRETVLPPIPSFSDFVKSQNGRGNGSDNRSITGEDHSAEKRMRLS
ncbi:hypothetical protein Dimus_002508 [Dionaea muscipula]